MQNLDQDRTALQRLAHRTKGVVTPANLLDGAAFLGARWAGPRLDSWPGIVAGIASYGLDAVDGKVARSTGTASRVGDLIDHVGDKPKVGYALFHIWRKGLAEKPLIVTVGVYNSITASIAVYDRLSNGSSRVEVTSYGKRAMFATATGIGLQTIASKLREAHPPAGQAVKRLGAILGYFGLLVFGLPAIRQYWKAATSGAAKGS